MAQWGWGHAAAAFVAGTFAGMLAMSMWLMTLGVVLHTPGRQVAQPAALNLAALGPAVFRDDLDCSLNYPLDLADIAVGVIGGREDRLEAVMKTWLRVFPSAVVYKTTRPMYRGARRINLPQDFVKALQLLKVSFPDAKFYWLSDEDTFVNGANLACLLSRYDFRRPLLLGSHHCSGPDFWCQDAGVRSSMDGWINGGAGVVLSRALVDTMDAAQCTTHYSTHWDYDVVAADVVLSCCVLDYWPQASITHHPGFFREFGNNAFECECSLDLCTLNPSEMKLYPREIISFHHLAPFRIQQLSDALFRRFPALNASHSPVVTELYPQLI